MEHRKVEGSGEAALGGGILAAALQQSMSGFIKRVRCDPNQTGDEVEFFVLMRGHPRDVTLRCVVTEVEDVE
jgi:hypothetical protein